MSCASHLEDNLHPKFLKDTAENCVKLLNKYYPNTDYIAVSGASGLIMGGVVSFLSGIPLIIVRKKYEECHSIRKVEFFDTPKDKCTFVILDDLISSGATIDYIVDMVINKYNMFTKEYYRELQPKVSFEFLGCILFADAEFKDEFYVLEDEDHKDKPLKIANVCGMDSEKWMK